MKKKIFLTWGVCLMMVFLVSLLSFAAPALAGPDSWTAEAIPSLTGNVLGPDGLDVRDIAVTRDGETIYAAAGNSVTDNVIYQSNNAGQSWTDLKAPIVADLVAVAPDNANVVAIAKSSTPAVYITTDGGSTWRSVGTVKDDIGAAAAALYDIAISAASNGIHYVAVAGKEEGDLANIWYIQTGSMSADWKETNNLAGLQSIKAIKAVAFSPSFTSDRIIVAVGESENWSINFEILSLSSHSWNAGAGFDGYPIAIVNNDGITGLISASISLEPEYSGTDDTKRIAFVGLTVNGDAKAKAASGIYRLNDTSKNELKTGVNIHSVAFNGANLIAGAYDGNNIYRCSNPTAKNPSVSPVPFLKRPGGENRVVVAWAGNDAVAGTSGNESAFAISRNNGQTFNDISLIDTALSNLRDVAISADGSKVYLVTDDGNDLSLWRKVTNWERVLSRPGTANYIVRIAPEDADAIYMAKKDASSIYYSNDGGETEWFTRTCEVDIQDLAIESALVIYALNSEGKVSKSTSTGITWGTAISTKLDEDTGHMIASVDRDNLLVGSTNGYVAYSTDGGSSWNKIPKILHHSAGRVQVVADKDFATNKTIYAASDTGGRKIKRWKIGTNTYWAEIFGNVVPGRIYGLVTDSNALYALEFNPQNNQSTLWQCLLPTEATDVSPSWKATSTTTSTDATDTNVFLNARPQALKLNPGGKLWAIKTNDTNRLYSFTDIMAELQLKAPEPEFINPVNAVTGSANEIVFRWDRWSTATEYTLYIALDEDFNKLVTTITEESDQSTIAVPVGPDQEGDTNVNFMPGAIYYWRVRVTQPVYNLYSETRSFAVDTVKTGPTVVIKPAPPLVIEIPPQPAIPDIVVQSPRIVYPLPPSVPPLKIIIPETPAPPETVTPTYAWVIIGIGAILVIAVMARVIQTGEPDRLEETKAEQEEDTGEIVEWAKQFCHITKPNSEMTDDNIRAVIQWIGEQAQDTIWVEEKPVFNRIGIGVMSTVMKAEFPEYYQKYDPSQHVSKYQENNENKTD